MSSVEPVPQQRYEPKGTPPAWPNTDQPAPTVEPAGTHTHEGETEHGDRLYIEPADLKIEPRGAPAAGGVPQVYAAMVKAMQIIGRLGVGKLGTNQDQGYKFRSIDQVYGAVSAGLSEAGLMILPAVITRERTEHRTAAGKANWHVTLKMMYSFICAADGSSHEVGPFFGEAFDTSDKATNKALTTAYKYMVIEVFCIPLVGLDDADEHTPEVDAGTSVKPTGKKKTEADPAATTRTREPIDQDPDVITPEEVTAIEERLKQTGILVESFLAKAGGIASIAELSKTSLEAAQSWITRQDLLNRAAKTKADKEAEARAKTAQDAPGSTTREPGADDEPLAGEPQPAATEHSYRLELAGGKELGKHTFEGVPSVGAVLPFAGADFRIIEVTKIGTPEQMAVLEYVKKETAAAETQAPDPKPDAKPAGKKGGKS